MIPSTRVFQGNVCTSSPIHLHQRHAMSILTEVPRIWQRLEPRSSPYRLLINLLNPLGDPRPPIPPRPLLPLLPCPWNLPVQRGVDGLRTGLSIEENHHSTVVRQNLPHLAELAHNHWRPAGQGLKKRQAPRLVARHADEYGCVLKMLDFI